MSNLKQKHVVIELCDISGLCVGQHGLFNTANKAKAILDKLREEHSSEHYEICSTPQVGFVAKKLTAFKSKAHFAAKFLTTFTDDKCKSMAEAYRLAKSLEVQKVVCFFEKGKYTYGWINNEDYQL
ncbi:hypothetical protein [Cysteiniphilum marinum]|uniref:hypothetical protein n=1 Tax=Cysteiniphilum marinum TaxID=2774191 RepID=UPI001939D8F8|nr:hypothetical protein [Cysteiniphilum marinum]